MYSSIEQARSLLTGTEDRIVTHLHPGIVYRDLARVFAGVFDFDGSLAYKSQWTEIRKNLKPEILEVDNADLDWYLK